MGSVAVALELRGRATAPIDEIADLPGPDELSGREVRRRLVDVTLLADTPGSTAFSAKTLQEGLCAHAILATEDVVATVREAAVAEIGGDDWLRDDVELTIDLVFEHADRATRRGLFALDPLRWARTVPTRGDLADARKAFDLIFSWHEDRDLPFALGGESGLRTSRQAITEIARRWPEVVDEHRNQLERDLTSETEATRSRALTLLGDLPSDERTAGWLVPCIRDASSRVTTQAAAIAARLRVSEAEEALSALLDERDERLRVAVVQALVEIVDVPRLPELAARVKAGSDLRRIANRLDERLDVDTGIELIRAHGEMNETTAWLVDRLVDSAHPAAWTPQRVSKLMTACQTVGGAGTPDPDRLARIFSAHPQDAIRAVRLSRIGEEPYASRHQLLPLARLDAAALEGDDHAELRRAVTRAVEEDREIRARLTVGEREAARLPALLDEQRLDIDPKAFEGAQIPRDIQQRHHSVLIELIERWWPPEGFAARHADRDLDARSLAVLTIGPAVEAPLAPPRWHELLDTHLAAPRFGAFELSSDGVIWWLSRTYSTDYDNVVIDRIADADGEILRRLAVISHAGRRPGPLTDAVVARLRELGADAPRWSSAATHLVDVGALDEVRVLLSLPMPTAVRKALTAALARNGDVSAQCEFLDDLTRKVRAGERTEAPTFIELVPAPDTLAALHRLADATITHGAGELRSFALGRMQTWPEMTVLDTLGDLADAQGANNPWISLAATAAARRFATEAVLDRLPPTLAGVAAWFEQTAPHRAFRGSADTIAVHDASATDLRQTGR